MKYRVQVKETNFGTVVVDADSHEDALKKGECAYSMGDVIWSGCDHELSNAALLPSRSLWMKLRRNTSLILSKKNKHIND